MKRISSLALVLSVAGGMAAADGLQFAEVYYGNTDLRTDDMKGYLDVMGAGLQYGLGDLTVSADISQQSSILGEVDAGSVSLSYQINDMISFGAEYSSQSFLDIGSVDVVTGFIDLEFGNFGAGAAVSEGDDLPETGFSAYIEWDVSEAGTLGLSAAEVGDIDTTVFYADYETSSYDLYVELYQSDGLDGVLIDGSIFVLSDVAVTASAFGLDLGGTSIEYAAIGAEYRGINGLSIGASFGQLREEGFETIDTISAGVRWELGERTGRREPTTRPTAGASTTTGGAFAF